MCWAIDRLTLAFPPSRSQRSVGELDPRSRLLATARWVVVASLVALGGPPQVLWATGCGGDGSADAVERSMNEFRLAATLREEGNLPSALQHLAQALELDPTNARAHLLLGYVHMGRDAYEEAEQSLRRGIELAVAQEDMPSAVAEARNLLGVVLINLGRHDEAVAILREAATDMLSATPYFAWGNLGRAYFENGEYDQALEALGQAVQLQPRFCLGHYWIGRTNFAQDDFESAEVALTQALEADERCERFYQDAWQLRGEARARLGRRAEAIEDFERCVELGTRTESGRRCQRFLDN